MTPDKKSRLIGYLAIAVTIAIWSAWIVYTRQAVSHALPIPVVALMRMLIPAVVLLPVIWRMGVFGRGHHLALFFCICGAGLPHIFLSATGLKYASSSDFSALVPGTMPIFVAILAAVLFKERFGWLRTAGLVGCLFGVVAIAQRSLFAADGGANFGHMLFLTAAFNYSGFTLAFRRSGLTPIEVTALIAFWSCLIVLPFSLMPTLELAFNGHIGDLVFQAILQGVLSNLIALVTYSEAVQRLGASKAAAFVALVPVVATLLAIPVLGEHPDAAGILGVVLTSLGVLMASGVLATSEKNGRTPAG